MSYAVAKQFPLVVDLDGTLLRTDMLHESFLRRVSVRPLDVFFVPFWLHKGKSYLKQQLANDFAFDPALLPYNEDFLAHLREAHTQGRSLILCTASNITIANTIAQHLGIFDDVMASDATVNLSGQVKAQALCERFGEKGFDYAGNAQDDVPVWQRARHALVVNAPQVLVDQVRKLCTVAEVFPPSTLRLKTYVRALRPHQWLKNILVLAPGVAAHRVDEAGVWGMLVLAFLAFSLCASSVYLINDALDLENDRRHSRKRKRPLAAGAIPLTHGALLAVGLFVCAEAMALFLNFQFFLTLNGYFALTLVYSMFLKRLVLVDCITLALLYTLRIVAGGLVLGMSISYWMLTFGIFLFLSLAFLKRYAELADGSKKGETRARGRGYLVSDLPLVQMFGIASAYTAVLVLALYMNSNVVLVLYSTPTFLWLALPPVIFWLSWLWMQAHRGKMHDDPLVFAVRDKASIASGALFVFALYCAS